MKYCPHCGNEYPDKSQYCLECGILLEKKPEPPRESILDHLRYGFDVTVKRPKIFLPTVIVYGFFLVIFLGIIFSVGVNYMVLEDPSQFETESISGVTVVLVLVLIVSSFYIALVYEPFIQHVYLSATTGNEINLRTSLKYAHSRILAFLGAYFVALVIALPVFYLWVSKLPYDVIMNYEGMESEIFMEYGLPLLLFVPVGILYQMALNFMVWADLGFIKAISESIDFIKHSYLKLLVILVLYVFVGGVSTRIPFGALLAYIAYVMLTISTIDIFHGYQDIDKLPPPQGEPELIE